VELYVYPAPLPIDNVKAAFTRSPVDLTWTPPQKTLVGAAPPIASYRIYRGELDGGLASAAASTSENLKLKTPLVKIGESDSAAYSDVQAVLDTPYVYSVRSVVQYSGATIESSDSNFAVITPRDLLPPAAPRGLLVVPAPAQSDTTAHLELSWAISPEPDIAGYYVYRSDSQDTRGARQTQDLLLTPSFRDISVGLGKRYFYSVTAVDRSGNESAASDVVSGDVPAQN
jgi:predicted phage tail protein